MELIAQRIANLLRKIEKETGSLLTIGTAESATGGQISDIITNIPGSSDYFKGAIVAYSNETKSRLLNVDMGIIDSTGAVSSEVAIEMADGARKILNVDICISDTGIAGPTGETMSKPKGLFYVGLSSSDGMKEVKKYYFGGSRKQNKQDAANASLNLIEKYLIERLAAIKRGISNKKKVVSCFLIHKGKILLLKRSNRVGFYQQKWSAVSGYITDTILNQAYTEINEETSLSKQEIKLIKKGSPVEICDANLNIKWRIYPFLFETNVPHKITIDWENTEIKWILPEQISNYDCVPSLKMVLDKLI
jgi:nicotinamide-nucleotide amidase